MSKEKLPCITGKGKTTELIKRCAESDGYIAVFNYDQVGVVAEQARRMGLDIRQPITFNEMQTFGSSQYKAFDIFVDNADYLLQQMLYLTNGHKVKAISGNFDFDWVEVIKE